MTKTFHSDAAIKESDDVWRNQFSDSEFGDSRLSFAGKTPKRAMKLVVNLSPRVLKTGEVALADGTSLGVLFVDETKVNVAEKVK